MSALILVRGIPGSGKSTLAKLMADVMHFEADMFFVDRETGEYKFDGMRIGEAHEWCQSITKQTLAEGYNVVVSNTFTRLKEMRPYFAMAKELNILPSVYLAQGGFRNVHGVPDHVLDNMRKRFEYDVTPLYDEFFHLARTDNGKETTKSYSYVL